MTLKKQFYLQKQCDNYSEYLLKYNLKGQYDEIFEASWRKIYLFSIIRKISSLDLNESDEIKNTIKNDREEFISLEIIDGNGKRRQVKIIKKLKKAPNCYEVRLNVKEVRLRMIFFTGPTNILQCPAFVFSFIIDKFSSNANDVEQLVDELICETSCCRSKLNKNNVRDMLERVEGEFLCNWTTS